MELVLLVTALLDVQSVLLCAYIHGKLIITGSRLGHITVMYSVAVISLVTQRSNDVSFHSLFLVA